jgi:hypothetical protein
MEANRIRLMVEVVAEAAGQPGVQSIGNGHYATMWLTTDHAASSYGRPVLVDGNGNAYGPQDSVPGTLRLGAQVVEIAASSLDGSLDLADFQADRQVLADAVARYTEASK